MGSGQKINSSTFQTRWDSLCSYNIGEVLMCLLISFFRWRNLVVPDGTRLISAELNFNFLTRKSSIVIARVHRLLLCLTLLLWHLLYLENDAEPSPWNWTVTAKKQPFRFKSYSLHFLLLLLPPFLLLLLLLLLLLISHLLSIFSLTLLVSLSMVSLSLFYSILKSTWTTFDPDSYHDCHAQRARTMSAELGNITISYYTALCILFSFFSYCSSQMLSLFPYSSDIGNNFPLNC